MRARAQSSLIVNSAYVVYGIAVGHGVQQSRLGGRGPGRPPGCPGGPGDKPKAGRSMLSGEGAGAASSLPAHLADRHRVLVPHLVATLEALYYPPQFHTDLNNPPPGTQLTPASQLFRAI